MAPDTPKDLTVDIYAIQLDGKWTLKDFTDFFHFYGEVYSLCFLLNAAPDLQDRFAPALVRYPWKGGYSAVNFYDDIYGMLGRSNRPGVRSISYASPGVLELSAVVIVALNIRRIVEQFTKSGHAINDLYSSIYKGLIDRKLLRLDVREKELDISKRELDFVNSSYVELSRALQVPEPDAFLVVTPNSLAALKVMLSLYRRVRKLAEFQIQGKAKL